MTQAITILGSTGSIGQSTLDVLARNLDKFSVYALTANTNADKLLAQIKQYQPQHVVMVDAKAAELLRTNLKNLSNPPQLHVGAQALCDVASAAPIHGVMAAIVGAAGLLPTLAAAKAGKTIYLANKEALVMSGQLFMQTVKDHGATVLPVDSEHNAIFQSLPTDNQNRSLKEMGVKRLILTASGGPFRDTPVAELASVTPEQACAHPNWVMGKKISVDSATMMNKGLEVIEAHWLFNAALAQIDVIVQPQSVIHSMVEYIDGSVLAELGLPDMRTPIAQALGLPERIESGVGSLDFNQLSQLDFKPLALERYPMMRLAYEAIEEGGTAPACLNAANEVAVAAFLAEEIGFTQIPQVVEQVLANIPAISADTLEAILAIDAQARIQANLLIQSLSQGESSAA